MARLSTIDLPEFVRVYIDSDSRKEVASRMGIEPLTVSQVVQQLQKRGVPLKPFRKRVLTTSTVAELTALAQG